MAIGITDKFKPKNNGSFALIDAADVEMPDGTRLSDVDFSEGNDGLTPFIGANGNWWIGETDTGVPAQGQEGPQGPQGEPGAAGADGDDGHTPVKGEDYWTDADKEAIVQDVLAAMPSAEGVAF